MLAASAEVFAGVPARVWSQVNLAWVAFYAVMGAANLWVAFNLSQADWVKFKVFGITAITLV